MGGPEHEGLEDHAKVLSLLPSLLLNLLPSAGRELVPIPGDFVLDFVDVEFSLLERSLAAFIDYWDGSVVLYSDEDHAGVLSGPR